VTGVGSGPSALASGPAGSHTRRMPTATRTLELLSKRECIELLAGSPVARVIFTDHALPAVLPLTIAVLNGAVCFRTTPDSRLAAVADGGVLSVQADAVDVPSRTGWSVVVSGLAEIVTDREQRAAIESVVEPWAPGHHSISVRVPLTAVSGRLVTG
jgi:nitroimidazol reductase NimA-like FMN-containing flavoprotein (pyridoxamine 5'-phosphate oxidase superfamily)